jgi:hypothetical protein
LQQGIVHYLHVNPLEAVSTVTVTIVNQLTGDTDFASPQALVAFALGLTLFVITLVLTLLHCILCVNIVSNTNEYQIHLLWIKIVLIHKLLLNYVKSVSNTIQKSLAKRHRKEKHFVIWFFCGCDWSVLCCYCLAVFIKVYLLFGKPV